MRFLVCTMVKRLLRLILIIPSSLFFFPLKLELLLSLAFRVNLIMCIKSQLERAFCSGSNKPFCEIVSWGPLSSQRTVQGTGHWPLVALASSFYYSTFVIIRASSYLPEFLLIQSVQATSLPIVRPAVRT